MMQREQQDINDITFEANVRISPTNTHISTRTNERALWKTDNEEAKITICTVRSVQFSNVAILSMAANIFDYSRNKRKRKLKC